MRLLDLFCGAGGAAMGYYRAGFREIVGIDNKPQKNYPFNFIQADALEYLTEHGKEYDAIHASPPCQHYSNMQNIHKNKHKHPALIEPTRELLLDTSKPFVIENVVGAPLRVDLFLCGSMFNLGIIRHRIFESSVHLPMLMPTCHHENMYDAYHYPVNERESLCKAMKIDWFMTRPEVREAVPPAYTEFIGSYLIEMLR